MTYGRKIGFIVSLSLSVGFGISHITAAHADPASSIPTDLSAITQQNAQTLITQYSRAAVIRYAQNNGISARAAANTLSPGITSRVQSLDMGAVGRTGAGGNGTPGSLKQKVQVIKGALPALKTIGPGGIGPTFIGGVAPRFDFTGDGLVSMDIPRQVVTRLRGHEKTLKAIVNAGVDRIIGLHAVEVADTIEIAADGTVSIGGGKHIDSPTQTAARDWVAIEQAADFGEFQFSNSGNEALW